MLCTHSRYCCRDSIKEKVRLAGLDIRALRRRLRLTQRHLPRATTSRGALSPIGSAAAIPLRGSSTTLLTLIERAPDDMPAS